LVIINLYILFFLLMVTAVCKKLYIWGSKFNSTRNISDKTTPFNLNTMEQTNSRRYSLQLSFEDINLPPFDDILVLGRKCPQGRIGVYKSFELLAPDEFEAFDVDDEQVETVFINKKILKKMDKDVVLMILKEKVFPFVVNSEIVKVDFKLRIYYELMKGEY
jgi:hypothetical protein